MMMMIIIMTMTTIDNNNNNHNTQSNKTFFIYMLCHFHGSPMMLNNNIQPLQGAVVHSYFITMKSQQVLNNDSDS